MSAQLTIRLALILVPSLRVLVLVRYLVSHNSNAAKSANRYLKRCNVGDWFLLTQIGQNVDPFFFEDFIQELGELQRPAEIREKHSPPPDYSNLDTMELNAVHVA